MTVSCGATSSSPPLDPIRCPNGLAMVHLARYASIRRVPIEIRPVLRWPGGARTPPSRVTSILEWNFLVVPGGGQVLPPEMRGGSYPPCEAAPHHGSGGGQHAGQGARHQPHERAADLERTRPEAAFGQDL